MSSSSDTLFDSWFDQAVTQDDRVVVLKERDGGRDEAFNELVEAVADHLVDLSVIKKMGGFENAVHVLKHRLPQSKRTRSGDLGEILATEFIDQRTRYTVPVRRLRYKDDRDLAMRGDDVLGIREAKTRVNVLKAEAKSRAQLSPSVVNEARDGLAKNRGRPNPSTLAFLEYNLRKDERDDEAELFARLQRDSIRAREICHLVFTLSGNDPTSQLQNAVSPISKGVELMLCGCQVSGHGDFVEEVFESCLSLGGTDGDD